MQAYSMDLRERALLDSDAGMKAADVAVKYRVSGSWVRLLKQRRRETGEVAPRVQRHGRRRMLEPHLHTLAALIAEQPDRTLAELKDALGTPASLAPVLQQARHGGAMDQGRQAGNALDAAVVPSVPGERSAPAPERPGLQPGQLVAQTGPAAADQALVAHESAAATGENRGPASEACAVLLAPVGRRASDAAAVRRHATEDLGAASAGRLTRGECYEARLAKKGHKCGAVSEECPESRGLQSVARQRGLR